MPKFLLSLLIILSAGKIFSQGFNTLGSATVDTGCHCYVITNNNFNQAGAVSSIDSINVHYSFDFTFSNFFGCNGAHGGDGEAFVLTTNPYSLGTTGSALGYGGGAQPFSLAVEFDTYQNPWDPYFDHTAFESGGSVQHNVAAPVSARPDSGTIKDCAWHSVRIVWDANTKTLSDYFDSSLRISMVLGNIDSAYFGGDSMVHWAWTAASGGATNLQEVCGLDTCSSITTSLPGASQTSIAIYPNPAKDFATVQTNTISAELSLSILSLDGKLIDSRVLKERLTTIDISHLAQGLYVFQLRNFTTGEVSHRKLEIQR